MGSGSAGGPGPRRGGPEGRRRWRADTLSIAVIAAVAASSVAPALSHGAALGPYDVLASFGVTYRRGVFAHNVVSADQIRQMIPWLTEAWRQVHAGHLPLWNPYAGLGMPLAFNWQSSTFSLPTLVAYAFPLKLAYTAAVSTKLLIAGSGAYVFGRVLGLGRPAAVFAGATFEVSGPFSVWAGYPITDVLAWTGWVLAFLVLVVRGERLRRHMALLAASVAWACLGGNPESLATLGVCVALFTVVFVLLTFRRDVASLGRAARRLVVAGVAGGALAAPLLLPATQVLQRSPRGGASAYGALRHHDLIYLLFSRFDGSPVTGVGYFGADNYYATAAYLGGVVLALSAVALICRWRQPSTWALSAVALLMGVLCYAQPVNGLLAEISVVRPIIWERGLPVLAFAVACLAGAGLEEVMRRPGAVSTWVAVTIAFGALAGVLTYVGVHVALSGAQLPPGAAAVRLSAFWWPVAGAAAGLLLTVALLGWGRGRWRRLVVTLGSAALFVTSTGFLVTSTAPLWSSDSTGFPQSAQVAAFTRIVGNGTVGITGTCGRIDEVPPIGLLPEANVGYRVRELAIYDSTLPREYYLAFTGELPTPSDAVGVFCPQITSAAQAHRFGVAYLVAPAGTPAMPGTILLRAIGDQNLYSVPGSSPVTLDGAASAPTPAVTFEGAAQWRIRTSATAPTTMHIRLAGEPGWHATLDGRPLELRSWDHLMLEATVPPGRHVVVLRYMPGAFLAGVALAGAVIVLWVVVGLATVRARGRGAHRRGRAAGGATAGPRSAGAPGQRDPAPPAPAGSAPRT